MKKIIVLFIMSLFFSVWSLASEPTERNQESAFCKRLVQEYISLQQQLNILKGEYKQLLNAFDQQCEATGKVMSPKCMRMMLELEYFEIEMLRIKNEAVLLVSLMKHNCKKID